MTKKRRWVLGALSGMLCAAGCGLDSTEPDPVGQRIQAGSGSVSVTPSSISFGGPVNVTIKQGLVITNHGIGPVYPDSRVDMTGPQAAFQCMALDGDGGCGIEAELKASAKSPGIYTGELTLALHRKSDKSDPPEYVLIPIRFDVR